MTLTLFDAKALIERLSSFIVPKIMVIWQVQGRNREIFQGGKVTFPDFSRRDCSFFRVKNCILVDPEQVSVFSWNFSVPFPLKFSNFLFYFFHFSPFSFLFLLPFPLFLIFFYIFHFSLLFLPSFFPISRQKFPGGNSLGGTLPLTPPPLRLLRHCLGVYLLA